MVENQVSLAVTLQAGTGRYALLLGSGVSVNSGVPSGWLVTRHLIIKIAAATHEEPIPNPESWYRSKYGRDASYSNVLEELGKTETDRSILLKGYFEPNPLEEEDEGSKQPTAAHEAIARLVSRGKVRIIITTNFDRLMETALRAVGIEPAVISSAESALNLHGLAHDACTIVKVNGDYLDPFARNTESELSNYPESISRLLERVFGEYGLIICGWSAKWDVALLESLRETVDCPHARYWARRLNSSSEVEATIRDVHAQPIDITDADDFFSNLDEDVLNLDSIPSASQMTIEAVIQRFRMILPEPTKRIRSRTMFLAEVQKVENMLIRDKQEFSNQEINETTVFAKFDKFEGSTVTLRAMFALGCFYGDSWTEGYWTEALERLAGTSIRGGSPGWNSLRFMPATLCLYAGGIAAVAAERYDLLFKLLCDTTVAETDYGTKEQAVRGLYPYKTLPYQFFQYFEKHNRQVYPQTFYLWTNAARLWRGLFDLPLSAQRLETSFDRFEFLVAMQTVYEADTFNKSNQGPVGMFAYRPRYGSSYLDGWMEDQIERYGNSWSVIRAGFFGQSIDRLQEAFESWKIDAPRG